MERSALRKRDVQHTNEVGKNPQKYPKKYVMNFKRRGTYDAGVLILRFIEALRGSLDLVLYKDF